MYYFVWIPIVVLINALCGILSLYVNDQPGWGWSFWKLYLVNIVAVWPFVAKISNNLLFDGVLYDSIMIVAYSSAVMVWGRKPFNPWQCVAIAFVVVGVALLRKYS